MDSCQRTHAKSSSGTQVERLPATVQLRNVVPLLRSGLVLDDFTNHAARPAAMLPTRPIECLTYGPTV
jgi:hypothetical protein